MPSRPVRLVSNGGMPVRVVTGGPSDPVRVVTNGPSDPVRVVTSGPSDPVQVISGSLTPVVSDSIGDGLRADAIAYWRMDEVSGNRADATGHGYTLGEVYANDNTPAPVGSLGSASGKFGLCAQTVDDPISPFSLYNSNCNPSIDSLAITGWFKTNSWDSDFYGLQASDPVYATITGISVNNPPDPEIFTMTVQIQTLGDGTYYAALQYQPMAAGDRIITTPNTWHFFDIENDGVTGCTLRINNGAPILFADDWTLASNIILSSVLIGYPNYNDNTDILYVDELGVWSRVLTSDERDYLWNSGAGRALYP